VDAFLPVHNLQSLADLAATLATDGISRIAANPKANRQD
jgi:hypothetical protein